MHLTIDANILVSEVDSETGVPNRSFSTRRSKRVYIAEYTWNEAMYVLDRKGPGMGTRRAASLRMIAR